MSEEREERVYPWKKYNISSIEDLARNFKEYSFLIIDHLRKEIYFKSGQWEISEDLYIPSGYTLIASAGTTINLNNGSIISFSPIVFFLITLFRIGLSNDIK